jgi:S1/P1 Nuclease
LRFSLFAVWIYMLSQTAFALRISFCALLLTLASPQTSFAWSADGHQTVGAIADALLANTATERKVKAILNGRSLEQVSVWADCVKGVNPNQDFSYTVGRRDEYAIFETPAGIEEMRDFVKRNDRNCAPKAGEESCHKQYHYSDIPYQRTRYEAGDFGTTKHDVVQAINAALAVLRGQSSPAPFQIKDQREALILLAHFLGDIHQPLHVGSIYLDANGKALNPAKGTKDDHQNHTIGGNALVIGDKAGDSNLHSYWDALPAALKRGKMREDLISKAKTVSRLNVVPEKWSTAWASDTLADARLAFDGVQFAQREAGTRGAIWKTRLPTDYDERTAKLKHAEIIKAGARLAQLLIALFP